MINLIQKKRRLQGCNFETSLDREKKENRYLLNSIIGKYYNIWDNKEKQNIEIVGKRNFNEWAKKNRYKTDF